MLKNYGDEKMEEFNLNEFSKKLEKLVEENKKLQHLKENYIFFAQKLKEMGEQLIELAKTIDPVESLVSHNRTSKKEIISEIFNRMKDGFHATSKTLLQIYPELSHSQLMYILGKIGDFPSVQKTYEGRTVRYYF